MPRSIRALENVTKKIERSTALDSLGEALNKALRKVLPPGPVEDVLSGTPLGHSLHPALVAIPIGAWSSAVVLDLAGEDDAARRLIGFGLVAAAPTAASGASDWLTTNSAERRVGLVHALLNYAGIASYAASYVARRKGNRQLGVALSSAGAGFVSTAGWLGGHLSYAQGVGVDTTAFQHFPTEWTDVAARGEVPANGKPIMVEADGVPLMLAEYRDVVVAFADRCTHRGAPLHEGEVRDGCIVCPWHGGEFSLADGSVVSGPPSRPQPVFEVRVRDGRVEVRREEERALRKNPVGR